jgi:hypothetical protein
MSTFEIYLLVAPLMVVAVGLVAVGLHLWLERREDRRKGIGRTGGT